MTLRTRRILYIIFTLAFFIITPVMIFYAAGYKFNLTGLKLQKTGNFIFNTEPRGAKIFIDEEPQQTFFKKYFSREKSFIITPAKIKNLLPGEYTVVFELEGYWPWQKKLDILPGTSTYAENVFLFKKSLPTLLLSSEIDSTAVSPDENNLAILANEQIIILDLDNENQITLTNAFNRAPSVYSWAPSSRKILLDKTVINIANVDEKIILTDYIKTSINQLKWDYTSDDKLYYKSENSINSFALSTKASEIILNNQTQALGGDYLVKNKHLYFISQIGKTSSLNFFNANSKELTRKIELPGSDNYYFINHNHPLLNLYDQDHQILYLINPSSIFYSSFEDSISNIKYTYWVNDNKLLYANDFEVWLYNLENHQETLLTRISQEITGVFWHPSNNYIIYTTDTAINTIELDQREKYNIAEIIKLDKIAYPFLNKAGDALYFYARIGNQKGLYKLVIQ